MTETLQMIFRNFDGRITTISVSDPDPEVTAQNVEEVMDSIVSKNVFHTTGGDIVDKVRAQVVSRSVNVLGEF